MHSENIVNCLRENIWAATQHRPTAVAVAGFARAGHSGTNLLSLTGGTW
jgi:hypothetical protein